MGCSLPRSRNETRSQLDARERRDLPPTEDDRTVVEPPSRRRIGDTSRNARQATAARWNRIAAAPVLQPSRSSSRTCVASTIAMRLRVLALQRRWLMCCEFASTTCDPAPRRCSPRGRAAAVQTLLRHEDAELSEGLRTSREGLPPRRCAPRACWSRAWPRGAPSQAPVGPYRDPTVSRPTAGRERGTCASW